MSGYQPQWDIDLRDGEAGEDAFVHAMLRSRVEHKRDHKAVETGRVAVEFEQRCRKGCEECPHPSGIAISRADIWAFEYAPGCWVMQPIERLKEWARVAIAQGEHGWVGEDRKHHNAFVNLYFLVDPVPPDLPPDPKGSL